MDHAHVGVAAGPGTGLVVMGGAGAAASTCPPGSGSAARGLLGTDAAALRLFIEALDYVEPGLVRIVKAILDAQAPRVVGLSECRAFAHEHKLWWGDCRYDAKWELGQKKVFGDTSCSVLAAILRENRCLTMLVLDHNQITDAGVGRLAAGLRGNAELRTLGLRGNQITDTGAGELAAGLRENLGLEYLFLERNQIADAGARALAAALRESTQLELESLDLGHNRITDAGAGALVAALCDNRVLDELFLAGNHITDAGKARLRDAWRDRLDAHDHQYYELLTL